MFGYPPPEGYKGPYWGCRSIYTPPKWALKTVWDKKKRRSTAKMLRIDCFVDIVPNRKTSMNMTEELSIWIDASFKHLLKWLNENFILTDSKAVFTWTFPAQSGKVYTLKASCNGSYGYIYIGAWEDTNADDI